MSKFTKYIEASHEYYSEINICPTAEEIVDDVIGLIEQFNNINLTDDDIEELTQEVYGGLI